MIKRVVIEADLKGVQERYRPLVLKSMEDMKTVLAHPYFFECFKDEIENSNGLEGELSKWKTATPEQIFLQLFYKVVDGVGYISYQVRTYYSPKRVIGFGVASDDVTNINTKYLQTYSIEDQEDRKEVGSNLLHEKFHDRGMEHDFNPTRRRKNSVAYLANRAYERAYSHIILKQVIIEEPKPIKKIFRPWWKFWR